MNQQKRLPKLLAALLIFLILCIPCIWTILYFTHPMEDASYNLSLMPGDGEEALEDTKGWTVFTNEQGNIKNLQFDGFGGFTGIEQDGQTFYFSRKITEKLDCPTLQVDAVNRTISIFLDDTLVYTDCPELDNRIGYLTLPMLDYDRTESITVSLPPNYIGRTLTIAQSNPGAEFSEKQEADTTVYPSEVSLYCGYSYESSIIASTVRTMIPAVLLFSLALLLLGVFLRNAFAGIIQPALPVFTLTVFFQMCSFLAQADFFGKYFNMPPIDLVRLSYDLSIASLLAFLTIYAKKLRPLFMIMTALQFLVSAVSIAAQTNPRLSRMVLIDLPYHTGLILLIIVLICTFLFLRKESRFFRKLGQATIAIFAGYILFLCIGIPLKLDYVIDLSGLFTGEYILTIFFLNHIWILCLLSSLYATISELITQETERQAKAFILATKYELAQESYNNMQHQMDEVQMVRHDTKKHYLLLQRMAKENPEKLSGYLDELLGQADEIRPIVASGNQMLDIILNGKLNTASDKGIAVKMIRSEAPETLPLTEADTCSLFMNILDNAIHAASSPDMENPYIHLDLHCQDQQFIFVCKNSVSAQTKTQKKKSAPGHGYGLKIIQQIMAQWGNMVDIQQNDTEYAITIILPQKKEDMVQA